MATTSPIFEVGAEERNSHVFDVDNSHTRESTASAEGRRKSQSAEEPKTENTKKFARGFIEYFNWVPPKEYLLTRNDLTYAQRSVLPSIKASTGLMIVPYYMIFMGTVFWTITFLFFIEAVRTDKPAALLREQGRGWYISGIVGLSIGLMAAFAVMRWITATFPLDQQAALFGPARRAPLDKEGQLDKMGTEEDEKTVEEMALPISLETYQDLMFRYFALIDVRSTITTEEIKKLIERAAVYHHNPLQFLMVIFCQLVFCVVIGVFSYGHGSVGGILIASFYIVYKLVCVAGKTISRTMNLITMVFYNIRPVQEAFPDLPDILDGFFNNYDYGLFIVAIGFQMLVMAQALSISNEEVLSLNFESLVCAIVSLTVQATSICVAMIQPDALTAAGTLVTFEFVAEFDDFYIRNAAKYLTTKNFLEIKPRALFHEDYLLVLCEVLLMFAVGAAVTNCIVGLAFQP